MRKEELLRELRSSILTGDEDKSRYLVKDMDPFQYRDTYGDLLDKVVHEDYGVTPGINSKTLGANRVNRMLRESPIGPYDIVDDKGLNYLMRNHGYGYNWEGIKDLFEDTRIPITNNLRYVKDGGDNLLTRNGALGAYDPKNGNIYLTKPTRDMDTWNTSTAIHEILHDTQYKEGFDPVRYGYSDDSLANPKMSFGSKKINTPELMTETEGGRKFMSDLYMHDKPTFNKIIENRGNVVYDLARGDKRAEAVFDAMPFRSFFSKGQDMAEGFWDGHHKYGVAEADSVKRLLLGKKLRQYLQPIAPVLKAIPYAGAAAGLAAISDDVMAGDYSEAGYKAIDMGISEIPIIGDLLQSDTLNEGEDELIMRLRREHALKGLK